MTEPEQWARELWNRAADAADGCATQSFGDDAKAAALTIQRAFEERERELRKFIRHDHTCTLGIRIGNDCVCGLAQALATRQDAPVTENSHDH